jgi:LmbE family N-acetylglucosaminyl deacetylase
MTVAPPTTNLAVPARALAIAAHPDDAEFGCAGTLTKWARAGCTAVTLVLTDGSKGSWEPAEDVRALIETRQQEQRAAAAAEGVREVVFLPFVDGELDSGLDARRAVCRVIREVRPAVVLGHDPWRHYRWHPDHRHAGQLAVESIVAARDPHFFPDLGDHHRPGTLLLWEAETVDHVEDISATLDAKLDALLCHRSQWRSTMGIHDDPDAERSAFAARIQARAAEHGAYADLAAGEAFKLLVP